MEERIRDQLRVLQKYREIVENANSVILRYDASGIITFFNEFAESLLGYAREEIIGAHVVGPVIPKRVGPEMTGEDFLGKIMSDPSEYTRYELPIDRRDGSRIWLSWSNHPIYDDEGLFRDMLSVGVDVTHRIHMEEELKNAKERAETSNRNKSDYLAKMSHEIRTPMNSIIGFTSLTLDNGRLPEDLRLNLEIIRSSGEELLALIDDVLDLSKIEAGELTLRPSTFNLPDALQTLTLSFAPLVNSEAVTLSCELSPSLPMEIQTDQTRLTQILRNLISNAVKHTASGEITLRAELIDRVFRPNLAPHDVYVLKFLVTDTGPGIPVDHQKTIFEPFAQTVEGERKPGTGLGLAIAKRLTELLSGDLCLRSEPGKGTVFELKITAAAGERSNKSDEMENVVEFPPCKILSVDDEPNNQTLLRMLMENDGNEMVLANNGKQALEKLANGRFDIIFMDLELPDMDGRSITREIRSMEGAERVPIIAVTAYATTHERQRCLDAGMDDFIAKPFKMEEISKAIRKHVHTKEESSG